MITTCPNCKAQYAVQPENLGTTITCKFCQTPFTVTETPAEQGAPQAPDSQPAGQQPQYQQAPPQQPPYQQGPPQQQYGPQYGAQPGYGGAPYGPPAPSRSFRDTADSIIEGVLGNPGIMVIMASVVILISIITFISALITASDYSYTDLAGSMVVISIFMFVMTLMAICCMVAVVGYLARISKALDKDKNS